MRAVSSPRRPLRSLRWRSLGQAIVNTWDVQSGFHPNPDVIYSGTNSAPQNEVLKLVE